MKYYKIKASLLAPLLIQQNRQSNQLCGINWIPGSTIRGAFAAKYLREIGTAEDELFQNLFINSDIHFPCMYPTDDVENNVAKVLPLTVYSCKRSPGFKNEENHGVVDTLAFSAISFLNNKPPNNASMLCHHNSKFSSTKSECGNTLKRFEGIWNNDFTKPKVNQTEMFYKRHTGIDRVTGTVANEIFYITQAISEFKKNKRSGVDYIKQYFTGGLWLNENQMQQLDPLLHGTLFVGADRTRGMGEMKLEIVEEQVEQFNVSDWDKCFKEKMKSVSNNKLSKEIEKSVFFSINLDSHAILVDRFLRVSLDIGFSFPEVKQVLKTINIESIRGWNNVWNLPKSDDTGVAMGSVYLFRYTGSNIDELQTYLENFVNDGVGLRQNEGFGQISACNNLHVITGVI